MPKKVSLSASELKVQSFVTSLDNQQQEKVKGGLPWTCVTCNNYCSGSRYVICWVKDEDKID